MAITIDFNNPFLAADYTDSTGTSMWHCGMRHTSSSDKWRKVVGFPITKGSDEIITSITFQIKLKFDHGWESTGSPSPSWFIALLNEKIEGAGSSSTKAQTVLDKINNLNEKVNFYCEAGENKTFTYSVTLNNIYWKNSSEQKYIYVGNSHPYGSGNKYYVWNHYQITELKVTSYSKAIDKEFKYRFNTNETFTSYNSDVIYNNWGNYLGWVWAADGKGGSTPYLHGESMWTSFYVPKTLGEINKLNIDIYIKQMHFLQSDSRIRWAIVSSAANKSKYISGAQITKNEDSNLITSGYFSVAGQADNSTKSLTIDLTNIKLESNKTYYFVLWTYVDWQGSYNQRAGFWFGGLPSINIYSTGKLNLNFGIAHWTWGYKYSEGHNTAKTAVRLESTWHRGYYGYPFILSNNYKVTPPKGFKYEKWSGPNDNGVWIGGLEPEGYQISSALKADRSIEYDYFPIEYKITYNKNGGTDPSIPEGYSTYNILYGPTDLKNKVTTKRTGYTFIGWKNGNTFINEINKPETNKTFNNKSELESYIETRTTGDITLTAQWEIKSYTYIIKHKSTSGLVLKEESLTNNYNTEVIINPISFAHYKLPEAKKVKWDVTSNTREIELTYTPIVYKLTLEEMGGNSLSDISYTIEDFSIDGFFSLPKQLTRLGYQLLGWDTKNTDYKNYNKENPFLFSKENIGNITIYAIWKPTNRKYIIRHYIQTLKDNSVGDAYEIREDLTTSGEGLVGSTLGGREKEIPGFTCKDKTISVVISEEGAQLNYYYNRNQYSIKILNNKEVINTITQYYGGTKDYILDKFQEWEEYNLPEYFSTPINEGNKAVSTITFNFTEDKEIQQKNLAKFNKTYSLKIDYSNGWAIGLNEEDKKLLDTLKEKGKYTYTDTIILPQIDAKPIVVRPEFLGWICITNDDETTKEEYSSSLNYPIRITNVYGDKTFVAQLKYGLNNQEFFGCGKTIYINDSGAWVNKGALMPDLKEKGGIINE